MKNPLFYLILLTTISLTTCLSLRLHQQMNTFADIITTSNHIDQQVIPATDQPSNKSNPKVAASIIIPIICVGLCVIFCFFCLKCAQNQQQQAQRGLEERIPCYCGPVKLMFKCCRYVLCIDILLRCLGLRRTNFEKEEEKRLKEDEVRRLKEEKERLKWEKKYGNANNAAANGPNPYQTQMRREDLAPASKWTQSASTSDTEKIKKQKCLICHKSHPDILSTCNSHCQLHLSCLVEYKNENKMSKSSNLCPGCQQNYQNRVKYYCRKCQQKWAEMQIESGNVYVSQLDWKAVKSVGERCEECAGKKWFQQ